MLFGRYVILDKYYFWVILFYTIAAALSFKDVASIAIV